MIGKPEVGNSKSRNIQREQWPTFDVNGKHRWEESDVGDAIKTCTLKKDSAQSSADCYNGSN